MKIRTLEFNIEAAHVNSWVCVRATHPDTTAYEFYVMANNDSRDKPAIVSADIVRAIRRGDSAEASHLSATFRAISSLYLRTILETIPLNAPFTKISGAADQ